MSWRLAKSLEKLRAQVDAKYPNRSKASDGTIGDLAHSQRASDHNPVSGVVHAWDVTHDPPVFNAHKWAREVLIPSKDRRTKYVISNGQVWDPARGWHTYRGPNPHTKHVHISVVESGGDLSEPWHIDGSDRFRVMVGNDEIEGAFRAPDGSTNVPLRALAEALGATVDFDAATNTVTVNKT